MVENRGILCVSNNNNNNFFFFKKKGGSGDGVYVAERVMSVLNHKYVVFNGSLDNVGLGFEHMMRTTKCCREGNTG